MKKIFKLLTTSILAIVMSLVGSVGCAQTPLTTIKAPSADGSSVQTGGGEDNGVGLAAGFALPHDAGLVDNDDTQVNIYDYDYYYLNEARANGADPGAWYVSEEDALDSYTKLKAREMAKLGSSFSLTAFEKETCRR